MITSSFIPLISIVSSVNESITVAAGTFIVDRVASVEKGMNDTSFVYISSENGIVKQELEAGGFSLKLELYEKNF